MPTEFPHTGATGTWSIDGGEATQFLLAGLPTDSTTTIYDQFYFTTPEVQAGSHTLTVTFLGDNNTTPLCIDFLYVKNGTFPLANNITTTPNQNTPDNHGTPPQSRTSTSTILGSVLGGLAFAVIIMGIFLFWRRRRAQQERIYAPVKESKRILTPFSSFRGCVSMAHVYKSKADAAPHIPAPGANLASGSPAMRKRQEAYERAVARRHSINGILQAGLVKVPNGGSLS